VLKLLKRPPGTVSAINYKYRISCALVDFWNDPVTLKILGTINFSFIVTYVGPYYAHQRISLSACLIFFIPIYAHQLIHSSPISKEFASGYLLKFPGNGIYLKAYPSTLLLRNADYNGFGNLRLSPKVWIARKYSPIKLKMSTSNWRLPNNASRHLQVNGIKTALSGVHFSALIWARVFVKIN
jgi:hypothetical protein